MERYYDNDPEDEKEPFFGSGDDNDDDEDDDDEEMEAEAIAYIDQQSIIDVMNMDLAQSELNHDLLSKAIKIARQNWLWFFKSTDTRLNEIEKIYKRLLKLTEEGNLEEEDDA